MPGPAASDLCERTATQHADRHQLMTCADRVGIVAAIARFLAEAWREDRKLTPAFLRVLRHHNTAVVF